MKIRLLYIFAASMLYSSATINISLDMDPSYSMITNSSLDNSHESYTYSFGPPALSLGYSKGLYTTKYFSLYIGGEFMMGRKSEEGAIYALHSLYLAPAFVVNNKLEFVPRFGLNMINTDTDEVSFTSLSGGYNIGVSMTYKVSKNYALSIHHVLHKIEGSSEGYDYQFDYNRYGITLSYGLDLLQGEGY